MTWLREMHAGSGKSSFGEQVAVAQPVRLQGLARHGSRLLDAIERSLAALR